MPCAGAIRVDSRPGAGSNFHLYLPSPDGDDADHVAEPAAGTAGRGRGERVLYVDDDEVMVVMVERSSAPATASTSWTSADRRSRSSAPTRWTSSSPDYNMPEHVGPRAGAPARRAAAAARGRADVGARLPTRCAAVRAAGVRAVLRKEHTLEELADLFSPVLASSEAPGAPTACCTT